MFPFLILGYSLLLAFAYGFPHQLWSFSAITVLPLWLQLLFWTALILLLFKETTRWFTRLLSLFGKAISHRQTPYLIGAGTAIFFLIVGQKHFLYGDSYQCYGLVKRFPQIGYHPRILSIAVYKLFSSISPFSLHRDLLILHALLAGLFAYLIQRLVTLLFDRSTDRAALIIVLLSGSTLLLYNHIEFYALPTIFLILTYYYFLSKDSFLFLIPALLAALFHPLLIYLLGLSLLRDEIGRRFLYPLSIFILILIVHLNLNNLGILLRDEPTYFFSSGHWLQIFNHLILASPPLLFLLRGQIKTRLAITWGAIVSLLIISLLNFTLGGGDWDLSGMILFPLALLVALSLPRSELPRIGLLSLLLFLLNSGIGLNRTWEIRSAILHLDHQGTPYLSHQFPGPIRLTYLLKAQYLETDDPYYRNWAIRLGWEAIDRFPHDDRGYLFLADLIPPGGLSESIIRLGLRNSSHSNRLVNLLTDFYKRKGIPDRLLLTIAQLRLEGGEGIIGVIANLKRILEGYNHRGPFLKDGVIFWRILDDGVVVTVSLLPRSSMVEVWGPVVSNRPIGSSFLLAHNELKTTGVAKFYLRADTVFLGATFPLSDIDHTELEYLIDCVLTNLSFYRTLLKTMKIPNSRSGR
ncbi:hypothetical protein DRP53_03995 [candidate division WOR-3 bacterium]|uniref:Uncharacterized protein n=1 Tax=candidate division WOR-3 bacterium TaxID=2052148 RepID=A0A660SIV8_UNCW3|nr:MAG: hypothetical protein DRP53_03995 [candidate division WOR-3 bacterium]